LCGSFFIMRYTFTSLGILLSLTALSASEAKSETAAARQRLDSIVSSRFKEAYEYDANGYTTLEVTYIMDTIKGEWVGEDRIEKVSDDEGNSISYARYYWDETLNRWAGVNRFDWSRDTNGKVLMYTLSTAWDTVTGQYVPGIKYENVRDQDGHRTSYTKYEWDTDSSEYLRSERGEVAYDVNGNMISFAIYEWDTDSSKYLPSETGDLIYDANGNNTSYTSFLWDQDSSKWMGNYRLEYTFDAGDNNTSTVRYDWDSGTSIWIEVSKEESVFDDNGQVVLQSESIWSSDSNDWILQDKYEREYDVNGFNTYSVSYGRDELLDQVVPLKRWVSIPDAYGDTQTSIVSVWENGKNDWVERDQTDYSFDYAYAREDLMTSLSAKHKITRRMEYLFEDDGLGGGEWKVSDDFGYYYTDLAVTDDTDLSVKQISIYPNPATDYIKIDGDPEAGGARVLIYDVSGKLVINQVLDDGGRIPVSHLSEGIYVVRLILGGQVKTGKIMIE
jgi:hypothetical protein